MTFINWIVERLVDVADFFYDIYQETNGWWYPFNLIAHPFYAGYNAFHQLAVYFTYFNNWVDSVAKSITTFFTGLDLESWFTDWKQKILAAWNWLKDRATWFKQEVGEWWTTVTDTIKGWIREAKEWAGELINSVKTWLGYLQSAWDNFRVSILPKLADWSGVSKLINSSLKEWFPFYKTLCEIWDKIVLFFSDPPQFIYELLDEFFDRFW